MGLDMVGGVFVVVIIGIGLGIIVAFLEFTWKVKRNPEDYKVTQNIFSFDDVVTL